MNIQQLMAAIGAASQRSRRAGGGKWTYDTRSVLDKGELRPRRHPLHKAKVLAKRRSASKQARMARRRNRS